MNDTKRKKGSVTSDGDDTQSVYRLGIELKVDLSGCGDCEG